MIQHIYALFIKWQCVVCVLKLLQRIGYSILLGQLVSDLHLDFLTREQALDQCAGVADNDADVLFIAGDLCESPSEIWTDALSYFCENYNHVVYVPGNHEYYHSSPDDFWLRSEWMSEVCENLHILECGEATIEGRKIAGATLWFEDCNNAQMFKSNLNDFRAIKKFEPWVFEQNRKAIELFETTEADVWITHHLPLHQSISNEYKNSLQNCYYLCDLTKHVGRLPKLLMHGHTHSPHKYDFVGCQVICNPLGYPHQRSNISFDDALLFEF